MIVFPILMLMDERACYDYLLDVLHPEGLRCPQGHLLPADQALRTGCGLPLQDMRGGFQHLHQHHLE